MTIGPLGTVSPPKLQFFLPGTSTPAAGAQLFTYAGNTPTKQTTYSDDNQTPNTNPIILDANGECVCFVDTTLTYAFTFAPSTDTDPPTNPYWTVPNMGFGEMIAGFAPLNSPAFTGTPTAPTPTLGDSSGNIATTQFVQETLSEGLSGNLTTTTQAPGTLTTQIATTAFVGAEIGRAWQFQAITSSTTFTVPGPTGGSIRLKYRAWGTGGGGGGTNPSSGFSAGGCGGAGGYAEGVVTLAVGTVVTVTINAPGTAGSGSSPGGNGGSVTISGTGISVTCNGGNGGAAGATGGAVAGGSGGTASGGQLNITGGSGSDGLTYGNGLQQSGPPGGAFGSTVSPGSAGFPGGGGTGAANQSTGTPGASGLVLFDYLIQ